jgi:hypothetical protein
MSKFFSKLLVHVMINAVLKLAVALGAAYYLYTYGVPWYANLIFTWGMVEQTYYPFKRR